MDNTNSIFGIWLRKVFFLSMLLITTTHNLCADTQDHIFNFANIKVSQTNSGISLEITKLKPSKDPEILNLTNPARLVIDLYTTAKTKTQIVKSNVAEITAIRIGQHLDKIRVVFDLRQKSLTFTKNYNASVGSLTVMLTGETAPVTVDNTGVPNLSVSISATPKPTTAMASATPSSAPSVSISPVQITPTPMATTTPSTFVKSDVVKEKEVNNTLRDIKDSKPNDAHEQVSAYTFKEGKISVVEVPRTGNVSLGTVKKQEQARAEQILDQLEPDTEKELAIENSELKADASDKPAIDQNTQNKLPVEAEKNNKEEASTGKQVLDVDKIIDSIESDNIEKKKLEEVKEEASLPIAESAISPSNDATTPDAMATMELNQEAPAEIEKLKPTLWEWIFGGLAILFGVIFVVALILSRSRKS